MNANGTDWSKKFDDALWAYRMALDPLKYIFQKPMPTGKLAMWQILLSEFNIIYVTQKEEKTLLKHMMDGGCFLTEPQISKEWALEQFWYQKWVSIIRYLLNLDFPYTNNMAKYEACILGLNMAVDMNIQELLVISDSDLLVHQVQGELATKNCKILPYLHHVQELRKRFTKIEFQHMPRIQNEFADVLSTLSYRIQHPDKNYIDPISVRIHNQPAYCAHVEEEADGKPWFHDIREYLSKGEYLEHANHI
ncbi:uncharacterized protein [Nicotiana sylvestris]|uniref:uncharacterized protein n=1 Tax=Nicotiana sylvestris TaxID=4096 RepID=UPI00388C7E55